MITVPSLDPCTDIENTDKVMITHANGTTETITGELLNKRNQVIIASTKTLTGTPLKTGNIVRVLFNADQSAANGNTAMVINYNSSNKTVKVCKNGALANYLPFEVSTGVYKYCQAYTTLELLYDGTNFIIIGNPVVLSGTDYTIFADGLKRVNTYNESDKGMITSNAVKEALDKTIPIPTDAVLHYSFDEVPDYPDGTAVYFRNKNFTSEDNWGCGNGTITYPNGSVNVVTTANTYIYKNINFSNCIVKLKVKSAITDVVRVYATGATAEQNNVTLQANELTELTYFFAGNCTSIGITNVENGNTLEIYAIYIGNGAYLVPVIDNSNGIYQPTQTKGFIAQNGVSGKCAYFPAKESGEIHFRYPNPRTDKSITISCWVKFDNSYTSTEWLVLALKGSGNYSCGLFRRTGNANGVNVGMIFRWETINSTADVTISKDKWHLITGVYNADSRISKIYIDGEYKNEGVSITNAGDQEVTEGAAWRINYNGIFQGSGGTTTGASYYLDDLLIFDRALSETEIKALYLNKANTPKYFNLSDYQMAKKLPPPPAADGNYTLKVNVASGVETYSWV